MIRSYICRQCRAHLAPRALSLRHPQWQPKATFISLRSEPPAPHEAQQTPQNGSSTEVLAEGRDLKTNIRRVAVDTSKYVSKEAKPFRGPGRYSKFVEDAKVLDPQQQEDYEEGQPINYTEVARQEEQDYFKTANPPTLKSTRSAQGDSRAMNLEKQLREGDLHRAWASFLENYASKDSAGLSDSSYKDSMLLDGRALFGRLLAWVTDRFCSGSEVPVSPSEVLFKYEQMGLVRREYWIRTLTKLTHQLLFAISGTRESQQSTEALLSELTALWRLFFQCNRANDTPLDTIAVDWQSLPDDANKLSRSVFTKFGVGDFGIRLQNYHPKVPGSAALGFCAVTYFNLFDTVNQDVLDVSPSVRETSAPFLRLLTNILAGSSVQGILKHTQTSSEFLSLPEDFRNAVIDQITSAPSEAMLTIGSQTFGSQGSRDEALSPDGHTSNEESLSPEDRAANQEEFFRRRIKKAVLLEENPIRLEGIWDEVQKAYGAKNLQVNNTLIPESLYSAALSGFMSLRLPNKSVQIWNHMIAQGIKPNIKIWTSMLNGCAKARDLNGLNAIWTRMLKSGVEPDSHAWTCRVNALISLRKINDGLAALDQMGKRWTAAETAIKTPPKKGGKKLPKVNVNNFTKPTIEVVTGAITALVKLVDPNMTFSRRKEFVHKVLQWAGNFSLKPNSLTYNALINLYLMGGDYPTSFKLLRKMDKEGIPPDIATYTILIRSAFENEKFTNLSEAEQSASVISILNELETSGLKLNVLTYSSIIDSLLKQYENFSAVHAVIEHMTSRNLDPGSHIYTSLMTQYFAQDPPNIAAVDSLWTQIMTSMGTWQDTVLFDRVIEGYANSNEVGKMMAVLTKMSSQGKTPNWITLTTVVTALANAGDIERVRGIANDVQHGDGIGERGVVGGRSGREFFFHVVVDKLRIDLPEPRAQSSGKSDITQGVQESVAEPVVNRGEEYEEQQKVQNQWNEQMNSLGTAEDFSQDTIATGEAKDKDWKEEDNGSMGGVPL